MCFLFLAYHYIKDEREKNKTSRDENLLHKVTPALTLVRKFFNSSPPSSAMFCLQVSPLVPVSQKDEIE